MNATPSKLLVANDNIGPITQLRPALIKYFRRKTGSAVEAEDLTQEVLLRAIQHTQQKPLKQVKGYIFRIAINCWRDRRRQLLAHGTPMSWDETTAQEYGVEKSAEYVLEVEEELIQTAEALEELTERTRTVLMLIRLEQMKVATVAEVLGISVSAVNKHLSKAYAHLAQLRKRQERP